MNNSPLSLNLKTPRGRRVGQWVAWLWGDDEKESALAGVRLPSVKEGETWRQGRGRMDEACQQMLNQLQLQLAHLEKPQRLSKRIGRAWRFALASYPVCWNALACLKGEPRQASMAIRQQWSVLNKKQEQECEDAILKAIGSLLDLLKIKGLKRKVSLSQSLLLETPLTKEIDDIYQKYLSLDHAASQKYGVFEPDDPFVKYSRRVLFWGMIVAPLGWGWVGWRAHDFKRETLTQAIESLKQAQNWMSDEPLKPELGVSRKTRWLPKKKASQGSLIAQGVLRFQNLSEKQLKDPSESRYLAGFYQVIEIASLLGADTSQAALSVMSAHAANPPTAIPHISLGWRGRREVLGLAAVLQNAKRYDMMEERWVSRVLAHEEKHPHPVLSRPITRTTNSDCLYELMTWLARREMRIGPQNDTFELINKGIKLWLLTPEEKANVSRQDEANWCHMEFLAEEQLMPQAEFVLTRIGSQWRSVTAQIAMSESLSALSLKVLISLCLPHIVQEQWYDYKKTESKEWVSVDGSYSAPQAMTEALQLNLCEKVFIRIHTACIKDGVDPESLVRPGKNHPGVIELLSAILASHLGFISLVDQQSLTHTWERVVTQFEAEEILKSIGQQGQQEPWRASPSKRL